jgi:hypothetical protein
MFKIAGTLMTSELHIILPFACTSYTSNHYGTCWILFELLYRQTSLLQAALAVYSLKSKAVPYQGLCNQVKHFGPMTKNDTAIYQHSKIFE